MGPAQAIKTCLAKSFQFKGRASRSEFWWFALVFIGGGFASFWLVEIFQPPSLTSIENPAVVAMLVFLAITLLPFASAGMSRFGDLGFNRVLFLVPLIILATGAALGYYDATTANPGQQYAGLGGAIIGYGGFLLTAPFVLLACFLKSEKPRLDADPNPNEVPS